MPNEIFYGIAGNSSVKAYYDGTTSYLEIDSEIIALIAHGPYQGFYNCYFIKGYFASDFLNDLLRKIGFDFYSCKDFFREQSHEIEELLKVFAPGTFYLNNLHHYFINIADTDCKLVCGTFGEYDTPLYTTKNMGELNQAVVEEYKQEIMNERQPIILSYRKDVDRGSETGENFLIDGHHKLAAYMELKVKPLIWQIIHVVATDYDVIDQRICKYLDPQQVESLKYFYTMVVDDSGNITSLKMR